MDVFLPYSARCLPPGCRINQDCRKRAQRRRNNRKTRAPAVTRRQAIKNGHSASNATVTVDPQTSKKILYLSTGALVQGAKASPPLTVARTRMKSGTDTMLMNSCSLPLPTRAATDAAQSLSRRVSSCKDSRGECIIWIAWMSSFFARHFWRRALCFWARPSSCLRDDQAQLTKRFAGRIIPLP